MRDTTDFALSVSRMNNVCLKHVDKVDLIRKVTRFDITNVAFSGIGEIFLIARFNDDRSLCIIVVPSIVIILPDVGAIHLVEGTAKGHSRGESCVDGKEPDGDIGEKTFDTDAFVEKLAEGGIENDASGRRERGCIIVADREDDVVGRRDADGMKEGGSTKGF